MLIRREITSDIEAIDAVHAVAFASPEPSGSRTPIEVGLVRALRDDDDWIPKLSLVAEDSAGSVVGHVVCSLGCVDETPALGLGPIGVVPEQQGGGIGGTLMNAVIAGADALDYPVVVLLGHLSYYPRFGFVPARSLGITPTEPAWGDAFQARKLSAWSPSVTGTFRYAAPFDEL